MSDSLQLSPSVSVAPTATFAPTVSLTLNLRAESKGSLLTREPVLDSDLADARAEAWRECFLRKGWTVVPFVDAKFQLVPIFREHSASLCSGFALEGVTPDGASARHEFGSRCLADVAHRAADRLVERDILRAGHPFVYEIEVDRPARVPRLLAGADGACNVTIHTPPLRVLSVPLRPLLQRARAEKVVDDSLHPVFFTEAALRAAERFSRKGAVKIPPVETGAALAGVLCSSPCGEFFSVVTDVLEATDADQAKFSLTFSGKSWNRIQAVTKARQQVQPCFRLLGNSHGHNFLPNDGKTCEACPTRPTCDLTNIFASAEDRSWTRAVFHQQPWSLCLIYGLSARSDKLAGLWGMHDGRLRERGYFVLPEFHAEQWELKP